MNYIIEQFRTSSKKFIITSRELREDLSEFLNGSETNLKRILDDNKLYSLHSITIMFRILDHKTFDVLPLYIKYTTPITSNIQNYFQHKLDYADNGFQVSIHSIGRMEIDIEFDTHEIE
jgi:hypothetical protein